MSINWRFPEDFIFWGQIKVNEKNRPSSRDDSLQIQVVISCQTVNLNAAFLKAFFKESHEYTDKYAFHRKCCSYQSSSIIRDMNLDIHFTFS